MKRMFLLCLILAAMPLPLLIGSTTSTAVPAEEVADSCELNPNLITWFPAVIECPICKTKNDFLKVGSYGNYIYQDPTKYQLVFWPFTDSASWYSCKKCRYTAYMGEFANPPAEKIPELRKLLAGVSLPAQKETIDKRQPGYLALSISARMLVVEKIQRTLGNSEDTYWNHFYRVLGYHFAGDGNSAEADKARRRSLEITEKMLADPKNQGERKQLLYIAAAMKHFLHHDDDAKKLLAEALPLRYANNQLEEEQNSGYDEYLSEMIREYLDMLNKARDLRK